MDKNFDKNTVTAYHADVNWRGFGIIPKIPLLDNRLTDTAKTIYSYFCAYGGDKKIAFPSRDRILRELNMSKTKFYSHFSLLKKYGYIKCHQEHRYGKYAHNTYVLVQIVPVSAEEYKEYTAAGKIQEIREDSPMPAEEFAPFINQTVPQEYPEASQEDWEAYFAYAEVYAHELQQEDAAFVSFDEQAEASASVGQSGTHIPSDAVSFFAPQCPNSENQCPTTQESQCPSRKDTNINMGDKNHTLYSKSSPCQSMSMTDQTERSETVTVDTVENYVDLIKSNISYDDIKHAYPEDVDMVDELVCVILDAIFTENRTVRINGENKHRELVKSMLLKLNYFHILEVIRKYRAFAAENRISNKHNYLLSMLYNEKMEHDTGMYNLVQCDMREMAGNYC